MKFRLRVKCKQNRRRGSCLERVPTRVTFVTAADISGVSLSETQNGSWRELRNCNEADKSDKREE